MKQWISDKLRTLPSRAGRSIKAHIPPRARASATFAARLSFEDVHCQFGETDAVNGLSLDVSPGEILCLLGPSGCGKSTLLRLAAGIERPTSGRIMIDDHEIAGPARFVPPEQRNVGLMFQDFALFPHLTIVQNVAFGLSSLPREEALREATLILSRVGLSGYEDEYPHILSGGQQQRVALARAIVPRPAVMLMDEPFSGLDVQLRDTMQEETLTLLRETRATSMIVTHHPEEAMRIGDRIAVMRDGRIIQVGNTEDLYHNPSELFVARLFSEINEIAFTVRGGEIETPIGRLPARGIVDGEDAVLCIRERGATITPNDVSSAESSGLAGRIQHVKFLGDAARLEVGVEGFDMPLQVRLGEAHEFTKAQEVRVHIDPSKILVFPGRDEETAATPSVELSRRKRTSSLQARSLV